MPKFAWLRGLGPLGSQIANVLTFLTVNWGVAVSAALAVYVFLSEWATGVVSNPAIQAAAITFLVLLWGYIGITFLIDRHHPRMVKSVPDYRYGLTSEGIIPGLDPNNEDGWLGFGVQVRNFSQAPIRYTIENFDLRLESRALPKFPIRPIGYLPRGGGKAIFPPWFKKDHVREFFGRRVVGAVEIIITYGHPEEKPARKLTLKAEITLHLAAEGMPPLPIPAFGANITEEIDEPLPD